MSRPEVKPYNTGASKKEEVAEMFNNISPKYDFLNHTLSMGIDRLWRRRAIRELKKYQPKDLLDLATGTADFAIAAAAIKPKKIDGVDISSGMLEVGRQKIKAKGLEKLITLRLADGESLPYSDGSFDAITIAFGIRNYEHPDRGLREMYRILREQGAVFILEFSQPERFPVKQLYKFYFRNILPVIGKAISSDKSAYSYLPESVAHFPYGAAFINMLESAGFINCRAIPLSAGIATLYIGEKKHA
jgi:demethylmenaquinone methyltransferase/2-methoxy-6-polyprenyl-1,4-benzoquinol methylase